MNTNTNAPVSPFSPWPTFDDDDQQAALEVLKSGKVNYWTGNEGKLFEQEFADFIGVSHAIAVANGSLALELALKAAGIGPGDDVIVTSRSFIASASCVVMVGARPIFADVAMDSHNLTADSIAQALTPATRAIIPVHLMGWPCEMDEIMALAAEKDLIVIEDCAQAHGATYKGQVVGSIGHINAFSFCQDKIMTTGGEGGMITTNDTALWQKAWSLKDHGKSYDAVFNREHPPGYRWLHESFGTNFRMTEMQSAIGRTCLQKLPGWLETRADFAHQLSNSFRQIDGLIVTEPPTHSSHAYYKYYVRVDESRLKAGETRNSVMAKINAAGIPCFNTYGGEIYNDLAFSAANLVPATQLVNARLLGDSTLQFLVHPTLSKSNIDDTARVVAGVMNEATC